MREWLSEDMTKRGIPLTPDNIYAEFISQVRDKFHIILCMSPVGDLLRVRCRMFPSLVNCCTLDWYDNWPEEALLSVSTKLLQDTEQVAPEFKTTIAEMFALGHKDIENECNVFYNELRRKVYITPKSYLDGINLYLDTLTIKRDELGKNIQRLANGIQRLKSTKKQIAELRIVLTDLEPQLVEQKSKAEIQSREVEAQSKIAEEKGELVAKDTAKVQKEAEEITVLKDAAAAELAKAEPLLKKANDAVDQLDNDDIVIVKSLPKPPEEVEKVIQCVLVFLGKKDLTWKNCKVVM